MFTPFAFVKSTSVGPYTPTNTEVINWVTATGITTDALIEAVDDFVSGCKTDGIWSLLDVVYPFVTDSTTTSTIKDQFKYNLVNTSSFTLTYTGSSTVGYGGYTNDANDGMLGTGFIPSASANANDFSMGIYTTSGNPGNDVIDMGSGQHQAYSYLFCGRTVDINRVDEVGAALAANLNTILTGSSITTGLVHGNLIYSTSTYNVYQRGTAIGTNGGSKLDGISPKQIAIGCFWYNDLRSSPTSKQYQFAFIGKFFDATDAANLNTRVDNLQSAVDAIYSTSRAVA